MSLHYQPGTEGLTDHEDERDAVISALQAALESFGKSMNELKRERDEAREALAATKHYLTKERDDALAQIVQAECRAERFCQERDEAREALKVIENERDRAKSDLREQCKGIKRLYELNTHLLAEIVLARQERDEARRVLEAAK